MFDAIRGVLHEYFLDRTVQVANGGHIAEPTVSEDSSKQLTHTGCQCNGRKLDEDVGSSAAELFTINLIAVIFHWDGISDWAQQ